MNREDMPGAVRWPLMAEGQHEGLWCKECGPGQPLVAEWRWVWVDNDQPGPQVEACRSCACEALEIRPHLFYVGPAHVAGVQVKVSAREQVAAVCVACIAPGEVALWLWVVCEACGGESRGKLTGT